MRTIGIIKCFGDDILWKKAIKIGKRYFFIRTTRLLMYSGRHKGKVAIRYNLMQAKELGASHEH